MAAFPTNKLGLLLLVACSGKGAAGQDSGDSAGGAEPSPDYTTASWPGEFTSSALLVTYVEVNCDTDRNEALYYAETTGWTSGIVVDAMETAAPSGWNDYHNLGTIEYADDGSWERLIRRLTTGVDAELWAPDVGTVFTCEEHFGENVMSFVFRTYDETGMLADCVHWGHDGSGLVEGRYELINPPLNLSEWSGCQPF